MKTAYDTETGRIRWQLSGSAVTYEAEDGIDWIDGHHNAATHYVSDGEATLRPMIDMPDTHTLPADTDWTLTGIPEGTVVIIDGEVAGVVNDNTLTLVFFEARTWMVTLEPVFPWVGVSCEVTVQ